MSARATRRGPATGRRSAEIVELPRRGGNPRAGLPFELTSFVGRDRELAEIVTALAGARVLTLTGAGGCGKTRLALRAAAGALASHPDGSVRLELAPLRDPRLVAPALAAALGVRPSPG